MSCRQGRRSAAHEHAIMVRAAIAGAGIADEGGLQIGPRRLRFAHRLLDRAEARRQRLALPRSEEHTSGLQSLMRISYAVFCLKKKKKQKNQNLKKINSKQSQKHNRA